MTREMHMGDIVRHFKRETVANPTTEYLYKILAFAEHTETGEKLVVYLCSVQNLRPSLRHVYERGGPRKISCD